MPAACGSTPGAFLNGEFRVKKLGKFDVGEFPVGMPFSGTNVWVVNNGSENVTELLA